MFDLQRESDDRPSLSLVVGVVLEAEHLCMTMRGAQSAGAMTTTTAFTGVLAGDSAMRRQFRAAGSGIA